MNQLFCLNSDCHLGPVQVEIIEGSNHLWKITPKGQTPWMVIGEKPRCPHCRSLLRQLDAIMALPIPERLAA